MGWVTDDGKHEGYVVPMFADGAFGGSSSAEGVWISHGADGVRLPEPHEVRPDSDTVAWQLCCDCRTGSYDGGGFTTWQGSRWERVDDPAQADLDAHRIFVDPDERWIGDAWEQAPEVERLVHQEWSRHWEPTAALGEIRGRNYDVRVATDRLREAVAEARRHGCSWADIGRELGTTRQSAHERWAHLVDDTTTPAIR